MHEGRGRLKEDLDYSSKVGHAAQVQTHTTASQPNCMVEQEGGISCLLIQRPGRLIYGIIYNVPKAY